MARSARRRRRRRLRCGYRSHRRARNSSRHVDLDFAHSRLASGKHGQRGRLRPTGDRPAGRRRYGKFAAVAGVDGTESGEARGRICEQLLAYGTFELGPDTYVKLVDQSHNSSGTGPEAGYAHTLIVPAGSMLDRNGGNFYVSSNAAPTMTTLDTTSPGFGLRSGGDVGQLR